MSPRLTEKQIQSAMFSAVQKLRGRVDVTSLKKSLLVLLFLRQTSLLSSRHRLSQKGDGATVELYIPPSASFNSLFDKRGAPGNAKRIDEALKSLEISDGDSSYNLFGPIEFNNWELSGENHSDEIFCEILEALGAHPSHLSADDLTREVENTAWLYDSAIEYFAELEGKVGEDFATPKTVGELIARLVEASPDETIYDPASGTGSLLVSMSKATRRSFGLPPAGIFGQEINASTCSLARMNLFIHGEYNHTIVQGDTLLFPAFTEQGRLRQFDVAISHPPFQMRWDSKVAESGVFGSRFKYGVPPDGKADYAFILHMLASLKPQTGRLCVVVSHGALFRSGVEGSIRELLIKDNLLDAVIGLPPKLFYNTGIPVAILLFRKDRSADERSILFINAAEEFQAGRNQNRLEQKHVDKISLTYSAYEEKEEFSRRVSFDEIAENNFNLSIQRYFRGPADTEVVDLDAVRAERRKVLLNLQRIEAEISQFMLELGSNRQL